jgi:hypothetical protein
MPPEAINGEGQIGHLRLSESFLPSFPPSISRHLPPFDSYEIRAYKPFLVAEVDNSAGDNSQAFRTLARYIGVEREGGREGGRVGRMFQAIALTRGALRE